MYSNTSQRYTSQKTSTDAATTTRPTSAKVAERLDAELLAPGGGGDGDGVVPLLLGGGDELPEYGSEQPLLFESHGKFWKQPAAFISEHRLFMSSHRLSHAWPLESHCGQLTAHEAR